MFDFCSSPLTPSQHSDLIAACIQAAAAIDAGKIQAAATRSAGWLALAAGVSAICGGVLAYKGAARQVWLAEYQNALRTKAYRRALVRDIVGVKVEINAYAAFLAKDPVGFASIPREADEFLPGTRRFLEKFDASNWIDTIQGGDIFEELDQATLPLTVLTVYWDRFHAHPKLRRFEIEEGDQGFREMVQKVQEQTVSAQESLDLVSIILRRNPSSNTDKPLPILTRILFRYYDWTAKNKTHG